MLLRVVPFLFLAVAALAGCGDDDATTTTDPPEAEASTSSTTADSDATSTTPTSQQLSTGELLFEFDGREILADIDDCPADQLVEGGEWSLGTIDDPQRGVDADGAEWSLAARFGPEQFQFYARLEPNGVPSYEVSHADDAEVRPGFGEGIGSFQTTFQLIAGTGFTPSPPLRVTVNCT